MTDITKCDRCGTEKNTTHWVSDMRADVVVRDHNREQLTYVPDEHKLCEICTRELQEWLDNE